MPLVDLANPGQSQLAKQLAGPFGDYLPDNSKREFDNPKAFKERSYPTDIQSGGDGVTNIDDPTYLGFNLMFPIDAPLFQPESAKDSLQQTSAIAYLNQRSPTRATYLKAFTSGIRRINQERPWYWQTIEGLSDAWSRNMTDPKDPYVGTKPGEGITIGCLEAIDLKLTALFSLYRLAVYDNKYRRFMLPQNLRYFTCHVQVIEIRHFRIAANWLSAISGGKWDEFMGGDVKGNVLDYVNDNTSEVSFVFEDCEWNVKTSGKVFDGVNNTGPDMAKTSIQFSYGNIKETAQFSGYDSRLEGDFREIDEGDALEFDAKQAITTFAKDQLANQANGALNAAERAASGFAQKFALGNIYGLRNKLMAGLTNPAALSNAAVGGAVQLAQANGSTINAAVAAVGGKLFGDRTGIAAGGSDGSTETTKIFEEAVQPTEVKGGNIMEDGLDERQPISSNIFAGQVPPGPGTLDGDDNIFDG